MSNYANPERIREIVKRRILGEPIISIASDMGLSRTYIYRVLSKLPKDDGIGERIAKHTDLTPDEQFEIVMDYLEMYPARQEEVRHGKGFIVDAVVKEVAEKHGLDTEQVNAVLYRVTSLHPPIYSSYPLYKNVENWKAQNLITMRDLAKTARSTPQEMNLILSGCQHMPLKTAQRISSMSRLSIYEIYQTLLELDEKRGVADGR